MSFSIPQVQVKEVVTQTGVNRSIDNISLLVITAPTALFAVGEESKSYKINSLKSFEDAAYKESDDLANNMLVWERVNNFYALAPSGTVLHVLLFKDTITFTDIFTVGNAAHTALLNHLQAEKSVIRMIGVCGNPDPATETHTTSISADLQSAIPLAQTFCTYQFSKSNPLLVVFEGRKFAGTALDAVDLTTLNAGNVSVMIGRDEARKEELVIAGHTNAANFAQVGTVLGKLAFVQVNQNIGRTTTPPQKTVKENLPVTTMGFSGGQTLWFDEDRDALYAKGYTFFVEYPGGYSGVFFVDDRTCQDPALSNSTLAAIRVTNKCSIIAYNTYMDELKSSVVVDGETGQLSPLEITRHEQIITDAIQVNTQDLEPDLVDEIVGITVTIDPTQNIALTKKERIKLSISTTGTLKNIEVEVGIQVT